MVLVCLNGSFNCLERYISACQRAFVVYIFVGFLKDVWNHASLHACSEFLTCAYELTDMSGSCWNVRGSWSITVS